LIDGPSLPSTEVLVYWTLVSAGILTAFKDETGAQVNTGTGASIIMGSGIGSGTVEQAETVVYLTLCLNYV